MPIADALIEIVAALIKELLPGSILFLLIGVTIGVVALLLSRTRRTAPLVWLSLLAIFYWLISLPIVPHAMEGWLGAGYAPLASAAEAEGAQHVVVLGGGGVTLKGAQGSYDSPSTATAYRLLEAERLYRLLGDPILILSGGAAGREGEGTPESELMRAVLVARGVPEERIWVETASPDTHENAILVGDLLEEKGVDQFVLVTSQAHMRRAMGAFAAEGMNPIPSAAVHEADGEGRSPFLPSGDALAESELVFREIFALIYYQLRGWLG
jgi:uncharacterized SAM-binding protein YcdF (DUF218 family)